MKIIVSIIIPTKDRPETLERLLQSIKKSSYKDYEVIVINDGGENSKLRVLKQKFSFILLNHPGNKGLAFSRTHGAKEAKGKYLLFIDDDNTIDKHMIKELVKSLESEKNLMAVGPITYYAKRPKEIWFLSAKFNLATSRVLFTRSIMLEKLIRTELYPTDNLHNCFMVRRELGDAVGWFDPFIRMSGTEFDMFMRIKNKFPRLFLATDIAAKCYHDVSPISLKNISSFAANYTSRFGRIYFLQRNRAVLTKRYGSFFDRIVFISIFYPFFFLVYLWIFLLSKKKVLLMQHIIATIDGYTLFFS